MIRFENGIHDSPMFHYFYIFMRYFIRTQCVLRWIEISSLHILHILCSSAFTWMSFSRRKIVKKYYSTNLFHAFRFHVETKETVSPATISRWNFYRIFLFLFAEAGLSGISLVKCHASLWSHRTLYTTKNSHYRTGWSRTGKVTCKPNQ